MRKRIVGYTLVVFLLVTSFFLPAAVMLHNKDDEIQRTEILNNEQKINAALKMLIEQKTNRLVADLLYIADTLRQADNGATTEAGLQHNWVAFANREKVYDQICYLDMEGNEKMRVNYMQDGAYAVDPSALQNKADSDYFTDSVYIGVRHIYISQLELSVEQDRIEQPQKPTICVAMPYYDYNGEQQGVVVLNYLANDILAQTQNIAEASVGQIYLLNAKGYWLFHSQDDGKEWGFMYPDRGNVSFAVEYPEEWKNISLLNSETFITENGLFNDTRLFGKGDVFAGQSGYTLVLGQGDFIIVSHVPATSSAGNLFLQNVWSVVGRTIQHNTMVLLLLFVISVLIAVYLVFQRKEQERIHYFSEYDAMTGIYNRRAGLERLQKLRENAKKTGQTMSLCFVDINGLKQVNDQLGHEKGDELIQTIAGAMQASVRASDVLIRLGGDEFLAVLVGLDAAKAEIIWGRIREKLGQLNEAEKRPYVISASHGIIEILPSNADTSDEMIKLADQKMYDEKRKLSPELTMLREDLRGAGDTP